jgi:NTP pyrophosphatase (non-canonical NTP hydrolase)
MPRPEIEQFAMIMEEKLQKNDHKGGWTGCAAHALLDRLRQETDELEEALIHKSPEEVCLEAADVANFCMMIADIARKGLL